MSTLMQSDGVNAILNIAHDTSDVGAGLSLRDAMLKANYAELRSSLAVDDVVALLQENPAMITQWVRYSEDKRTSSGWYLLESQNAIGCLSEPARDSSYETLAEATGNFILNELDYWASRSAA